MTGVFSIGLVNAKSLYSVDPGAPLSVFEFVLETTLLKSQLTQDPWCSSPAGMTGSCLSELPQCATSDICTGFSFGLV